MPRIGNEQAFHDKVFKNNSRAEAHKYHSVARKAKQSYERLLLEYGRGRAVLDYGCGPGLISLLLAEHGARVTGIDISPVAIEQAARRADEAGLADRMDFLVMDASQLSFADDSFDLVCGMAILHHLDLRTSYAEIGRVLKPGGVAVFYEPLGHNPIINLYRRRTPHLRTEDEHPLLVRDLELAGQYFDVTVFRYFHLFSFLATPFRRYPWFDPLVRALDAFDAILFKMLPFLRRQAWIVVAVMSRPAR